MNYSWKRCSFPLITLSQTCVSLYWHTYNHCPFTIWLFEFTFPLMPKAIPILEPPPLLPHNNIMVSIMIMFSRQWYIIVFCDVQYSYVWPLTTTPSLQDFLLNAGFENDNWVMNVRNDFMLLSIKYVIRHTILCMAGCGRK